VGEECGEQSPHSAGDEEDAALSCTDLEEIPTRKRKEGNLPGVEITRGIGRGCVLIRRPK